MTRTPRMSTIWIPLSTLLLASTANAQAADGILSRNIKEADGTTLQDTENGSGIKTNHIQDGAVTSAKLAGPISRSKLERYARVAVVAKSGGDYADPRTAMANRATWCPAPSDASPCLLQILPGTYDVGSSGLRVADFIDVAGAGEGNTRLVGAVDGPNESLGVITGGWMGAPDENGLCEVRDVTIENTGNAQGQYMGVLNVRSLSRVTVISMAGTSVNRGVMARNGFASTLQDVKIFVGGAWVNMGVANNWGAPLTLRNVQVTATGAAGTGSAAALVLWDGVHQLSNVELHASTPEGTPMGIQMGGNVELYARNVVAVGEGPQGIGVFMSSGKALFDGSLIGGGSKSLEVGSYYPAAAYVSHSRLDGGAVAAIPTSTLVCAAVTDENFAFFPSSCP